MHDSPIRDLLAVEYFGNSLLNWGLALLAFLFTFLVLPFLRGRIHARQARWREGLPDTPALELLSRILAQTNRLVLLVVALYLAEKILSLPKRVDRIFDIVIVVGVWLQMGIWANVALRFFIWQRQRRSGAGSDFSQGSVDVLMFCAQLIIWAILVLLALDNLGINITALVAGLGVGGIAVALAVQTILGDLFASLSIAFDKPFVPGDILKLDAFVGAVEHIGIKSTRLRGPAGELIILANADVLKSRVRNLGREPRALFRLYVAYETPADTVAQVPALVKAAVDGQAHTRYGSCLLADLGQYAMEFEVLYFILPTRTVDSGVVVDAVNHAIVAAFAAAGVKFAYPTRRTVT
jgi:small-conductance mechanosensitive channel